MSFWVSCNSCFLCPSAERTLAVTTCGHVLCSTCFQEGNPGKCFICGSKCQASALSEKTSDEVKALFSDISFTATRHLAEISKVVKFQARHQKRILAYYQQKNKKLEEVLVKMRQEMQQMTKKLSEQSSYVVKLENSLQQQRVLEASAVPRMSRIAQTPPPHAHGAGKQLKHTPAPGPALTACWARQTPRPHRSPVSLSRHSSLHNITESMALDGGGVFRKPAPRLSFMAPPPDARLGPSRSPLQNGPSSKHATCSASVSRSQGSSLTPNISFSQTPAWKSPLFKPLSSFRHSMSSPACQP